MRGGEEETRAVDFTAPGVTHVGYQGGRCPTVRGVGVGGGLSFLCPTSAASTTRSGWWADETTPGWSSDRVTRGRRQICRARGAAFTAEVTVALRVRCPTTGTHPIGGCLLLLLLLWRRRLLLLLCENLRRKGRGSTRRLAPRGPLFC
eukprot:Hpha_TRINITY_DN15338_c0_g5::TRINITY_DN15338_c0_g5_i2::g.89047::m.89047